MECSGCGHANKATARFCENCGAPQKRSCKNCGAPLSGSANFCPECGERAVSDSPKAYTPKHLADKILTSKAALEGERKQVTVLFADIKDSMELLAGRDPEEARRILDPVLTLMMDAVHRHEGTVNQVMGDGIMALFGAPLAHEDHAIRACYAALRMQESVKRHAVDLPITADIALRIRVGLNSGEVVVRSIGSDLHMDYTAVGQTTHVAARMEQMAMPGSILLPVETFRLVEGYVNCRRLGERSIKGLEGLIDVYEIVGPGPVRSRLQAATARGLTPFVGRRAEMETLQAALARASRGHGQVVAMIGDPGIGKSRLLWEFVHSAHAGDWLVVESAAVSSDTKAASYPVVIDLLKDYLQVNDRDDLSRVRQMLADRLLMLELPQEMLPPLLALFDLSMAETHWAALDPAQRRQKTLDAVKRLMIAESRSRPLILTVENLHWIDLESQALLDDLVESLQAARALLLVNYRPEYQHRWGNKPYYTQLRLDRLPRQNVEQLLQSLIGLDASTRSLWQLLVDKTEGNPFFLEESVRTLAEAGVLVGERGAYRLARASSRIDIPATVQAVLAARIDRLPPSEKRLLQSASVIGKDVPLPLLRAVSELPEDMLLAAIQHLQAGEFIFELRLFPEAEYSFTHALTQGVAYASVLQDRRRDVHAAIVEAMERLYPNPLFEQVEQLAHHAFCGELWKKAADYSRYAGTHAYARSALQQAVTLFEQALAALVHLPDNRARTEQAIELHLQTRHALLLLGDIPKILPHLLEAETLAELLVERRRLGHVLSNMTQYFCITGNLPRGIETGHRAIIIARAHDDLPLRITTMFHLGLGYYGLGDYIRASALFSEHLETLSGDLVRERFGMAGFPSVFCRAYLALCRADMGAFVDALAVAEEAVRIAELLDQPYSLSIARSYLGETWLLKGDLPKAIAVLEQALQLCNDRSILGVLPTAGSDLGYAYALSGRLCEALPLLEQAAEHTLATGPQGHSRRLTLLGDAYLRAGRSQEALKAACRALTIARQEKRRANEAWTFRLLGEIDSLGDSGDLEKSETRYRDAMALATELGMRPLVAHCHLGLGKLHRRAGKRPALEEHLSVAATMYRDMDMRFWQEQAEAEMGSRSTESQRVP